MFAKLQELPSSVRQYILLTTNYWFFTLTDGALRMLVVLHFYQRGYSALAIASLFLFYEFFGVVTNLFGGWLGARIGLNKTMNIGLGLQIVALLALTLPPEYLSVPLVMAAQAISGIAKDLNKMSAKSGIKYLIKESQSEQLYKWVAFLTGSKNTLKGIGFFVGGVLLVTLGFQYAMLVMAIALICILTLSFYLLTNPAKQSKFKPKFKDIFSKSKRINILSAARMFLFGARDIWFVVALPVYLSATFDWDHWHVGGFLALWVIFYGIIQGIAPRITKQRGIKKNGNFWQSNRNKLSFWSFILTLVSLGISLLLYVEYSPQTSIVVGLLIFGGVFAINSSMHSYLVVHYAASEHASIDVGFYYTANATGRLIGTILSGSIFQFYGLVGCLIGSTIFLAATSVITIFLEKQPE